MSGDDQPLLRVTGGGEPSSEQLAALTMAVLSLQAEAGSRDGDEPRLPAWRRAAIAEGVGGRSAWGMADVDRLR